MRRGLRSIAVAALAATLLAGGAVRAAAGTAAASAPGTTGPGRHTYTGAIDGASYRVETPEPWNGTLVLYSHGYYPEGFPSFGIALTNRRETEAWLLDHGYALAASDFKGRAVGELIKTMVKARPGI